MPATKEALFPEKTKTSSKIHLWILELVSIESLFF